MKKVTDRDRVNGRLILFRKDSIPFRLKQMWQAQGRCDHKLRLSNIMTKMFKKDGKMRSRYQREVARMKIWERRSKIVHERKAQRRMLVRKRGRPRKRGVSLGRHTHFNI